MSDRRYVIPVVAHRLIGRTVRFESDLLGRWGRDRLPGLIPDLPSSPGVFEVGGLGSIEVLPDPSQGTQRSVEEIRALFEADPALSYTSGLTVHEFWAAADIQFELIAVADRPISSELANFLPSDHEFLQGLANDFNVPRALNLYFARDIFGAWGTAYPVNPDEDSARDGHGYAFVSDRYVEGEAIESEGRWRSDVITTAHELGHTLGLIHRQNYENLMYAYGTTDSSTELEAAQQRAAEYYARRFNRSVYAPDEVPVLMQPRNEDIPFF